MRHVAVLVALLVAAGCSRPEARNARVWNRQAAATYLDRRADWWLQWPAARRDHGTSCVSCHTTLPYVLARARLDESGAAASNVQRVIDNVRTRVRLWSDIAPYYTNRPGHALEAAESRGTEAVLNALILARAAVHGVFDEDAQAAFEQMWALQETDGDAAGAWPWLRFGLEPWEGKDSKYYGAALAALAVGAAPDGYQATPAVREHVQRLRAYLDREYAQQPLANRLVLLWANATLHDLVPPDRQTAIVDELVAAQSSGGGWSLASLSAAAPSLRTRLRSIVAPDPSDGYATGLAALVLLDAQPQPRRGDALQRALAWLARNQNADGVWTAASLNARRNPASDAAKFMSDAATAYAVLALTTADAERSAKALAER